MLWLESKFKTTSENLDRTIELLELNSEYSFSVFDSEDFKNFFSEHPELNDLIEPELREKFEDISELRLYFEVSNESRDEIHRLSKLLDSRRSSALSMMRITCTSGKSITSLLKSESGSCLFPLAVRHPKLKGLL
jgi:ribosomal protein L11 methylase PrmA